MSYTYTQLKDAIQNYTDNNETTFVANLDRFIKNANLSLVPRRDYYGFG